MVLVFLLALSCPTGRPVRREVPASPCFTNYCPPTKVMVCGKPFEGYSGWVDVCTANGADEGPFRGWFAKGHPWMEGTCQQGALEGAWREWSSDGSVRVTGDYRHGRRDGLWREPVGHDGGTVVSRYRDGIKVSWEVFDDHGRRREEHVEGNGHTLMRSFGAQGRLESEEFSCPTGELCPASRGWFSDGRLHIVHARKGKNQHFIVFFPDGTKEEELDTYEGEARRWYPDGRPMSWRTVRAGKIEGPAVYFTPEGKRIDQEFRGGVLVP